jgi:hypothetical protein
MSDVEDLFNCFDEEPEEVAVAIPVVENLENEMEQGEIDENLDTSKNSLKRPADEDDVDEAPKKQKIESLLDDIK